MTTNLPRHEERAGLWWRPSFFYGWVIVSVTSLAGFLSAGMGGLTLAVFLKPMQNALGWSLPELTGAVALAGVTSLFFAPPLGALVDRYGARWVMATGALAAGGGLLLMMGVQSVWQFWLLFAFISAVGMNQLSSVTGPVVVSKWFVRQRGRAMAIFMAGIPLGAAIMVPIVALLIESIGWRLTWGVMGGFTCILLLPLVLLFVRGKPEDVGLTPDGDAPVAEETSAMPNFAAPLSEPRWTMRQALGTKTFWLLVLAINFEQLTAGAMVYHQVPWLTSQGMSYRSATSFLAIFLGITGLTRIPWGFMVERVPLRYSMSFLFFNKALGVLTLVVIPYPFSIGTYLFFSALVGGAEGLVSPLSFANYYGRAFTGSIQGMARLFLSPMQLVGPLLFALAFDATGTYKQVFMVAAGLGMFAGLLAFMAKAPLHRQAMRPVT